MMTDANIITLISLSVTILPMLGVPVFLAIAYWVVGTTFVLGQTLDSIGAALSDVFTDGFALPAMPPFILTGDLINKSGIARRLTDFAHSCPGWMRGGLAMAAIGACGLFAAISGSNSTTTATIGSMPADIIPGALMVLAMQFACWIICRLNGSGHLISLQMNRVLKTGFGAWLGFFAIGSVLWGICTGKFSPTPTPRRTGKPGSTCWWSKGSACARSGRSWCARRRSPAFWRRLAGSIALSRRG